MDDVIYRQEAVNELREYITEPSISDDESEIIGYNDGIELSISVLSTLPSAQQWISCSDQLPEEFKSVLCCTDEGEIFIAHAYIFDDGNYSFDDENGMIWEGNVVAWMRLPDAYRGE